MQIVLVGNFGVGNLGDELIVTYYRTRFPEHEWRVVSAHPKQGEFCRLPLGIRSLFYPWWRTLGAFRKADAVIFAGGTLFTDTESVYACILWWWHALWARCMGARVLLCFQGIGPFRGRFGEWFTKGVLQNAQLITVRDVASAARAEAITKNKKVVQTCDPVFWLLKDKKSENSSKNVLAIIPRENSSDDFLEKARMKAHEGGEYHVISFQPDSQTERDVCRAIGGERIEVRSLDDVLKAFSDVSLVLTHRFHGAVIAQALGIPCETWSQAAGDKLSVAQQPELLEEGEKALTEALMCSR